MLCERIYRRHILMLSFRFIFYFKTIFKRKKNGIKLTSFHTFVIEPNNWKYVIIL